MSKHPAWQYDEFKHCGIDYGDPAQVAVYDERHQRFRDYAKDTAHVLELLELGPDHTVIDMGCGTGAFAIHAARQCRRIHAVDVSPGMLGCARRKAKDAGLDNIEFHHGGFLTYEHRAEAADAMVVIAALHHLPDLWKLIGLKRAAGMLAKGGRLYLGDVVLPSDIVDNYESRLDDWVRTATASVGAEFQAEVETHIRDEYSTYDWIMEGLLERAGFRIERTQYREGFFAEYVCTRQ